MQLRDDLTRWYRVRRLTGLTEMVEPATAARLAGDWRAAAAAARVDVELDLDRVRNTFGAEAASTVDETLHHTAWDLLWWHLPRHRGGMTTLLARESAVLLPALGARELPLLRLRMPLSPFAPQRLQLTVVSAVDLEEERWFALPWYAWDIRRASELLTAWGGGSDRPPLLDATGAPLPAAEIGLGEDAAGTAERVYTQLASGHYEEAWHACGVDVSTADVERAQPRNALPTCPVGMAAFAREVAAAFEVDEVGTAVGVPVRLNVAEPRVSVQVLSHQDYVDLNPRILTDAVPPDLLLLASGRLRPGDLHPLMTGALFPTLTAPAAPVTVPAAAAVPAGGASLAAGLTPAGLGAAGLGSGRLEAVGPAGWRSSPGEARPVLGAPVRVRCRGEWHQVSVSGGELRLHDHDAQELQREKALRSLGGETAGCFAARQTWLEGGRRLPKGLAEQRREVRQRMLDGDEDWLIARIEEGVLDPLMRDANGWSLMHMATASGSGRLPQLLAERGTPVDAADLIGRTPLYVAVLGGGTPFFVRWLVLSGADQSATTVHDADIGSAFYRGSRHDLAHADIWPPAS